MKLITKKKILKRINVYSQTYWGRKYNCKNKNWLDVYKKRLKKKYSDFVCHCHYCIGDTGGYIRKPITKNIFQILNENQDEY